MAFISPIILLLTGLPAYFLTRKCRHILLIIPAVLLLIFIGSFAALFLAHFIDGDENNQRILRAFINGFWFSVFGAIGGAYFGKKIRNKVTKIHLAGEDPQKVNDAAIEEKPRYSWKVLTYVMALAAFSSSYYGFKTVDGFLNGTSEQIAYDVGYLIAGMLLPWVVALPISLGIKAFAVFKKQKKSFLINWINVTALTATLWALTVFTLRLETSHTNQHLGVACFQNLYGTDQVPQDIEKAIPICAKAAQAGDAGAQNTMGEYFLAGGDEETAAYWFHKAAEQGHTGAMERLESIR